MTPEEIENELRELSAENLALKRVLTAVLNRIGAVDSRFARAIGLGFEDAASAFEDIAVEGGTPVHLSYGVEILRIIQDMRAITVGYPEKRD